MNPDLIGAIINGFTLTREREENMINTARILTIVTLILVFSVFYLETASAEITINGNTIHVETNNYKVQFDYGAITYLHNKLTNETYTLPLDSNRSPGFRMTAGILAKNRDFLAHHATTVNAQKISSNHAEIRFREGGNEIRLIISIESNTDDLLISVDGVTDIPTVYGIDWGIENLNLNTLSLILPSKGGQIIDAAAAMEHEGYPYPSADWQVQLAIIQSARGGFYVRGTDTTFQSKALIYHSDTGEFGLGFRTHNQAPWDTLTSAKSVTWRLNTYVGDWCVPAQIYRDWMEQTFDPWRLSDMPAWVGDISLVVTYSRLDAGILERLAELVDPTKTLLYLTEWRTGHPYNYPDYTPRGDLGNFMETAHRLGFRVMLHTSLHDISATHPLYSEFKRYQYRHPYNGKLAGWKWEEIDAPDRYAHINPASSQWRNLLIQQWKAVWEKYKVDAFLLDTSHFVPNDANGLIEGLTGAQGNVLMHKELVEAMPGVVFGGEELHEVTFFRESFAQRWPSKVAAHPISAFLFSPYTRPYAYLGIRLIEHPEYHTMLNAYEGRGVLPSVHLPHASLLDRPLTQQMLSVFRRWQDLGLKPDVGCDWGPNTLFQYTTRTGETATYQRKPSGSVLILPNGGGYERVFNATQAQTNRGLAHWRGYNETHLIGLNPNRAYFLDNAPRDFSQVRVNSLFPDVYISETRVTDHAALFRFESTGSDRETTVGFFLPTTPVGSFPDTLRPTGAGQYTLEASPSQPVVIFLAPFEQISLPYDLIEAEAQYTAGLQLNDIFRLGSTHGSGERTRANIDNIEKEVINAIPPTRGQTVLQFPLLLPQEPSNFSFSMGLYEGCSKGVLFQIRLNGQTYFEAFKDTFDWKDGSISLSAFAGQPLLLELVTDPAQEGSAGADCDAAFWGDLHITAAPTPDANLDGRINILDLILVAGSFGEQPPSNSLADTNKDGVVNLLDLVFVAEHLSQNAAAPSQLALIESIPSSAKEVIAAQRALSELEAMPNKSHGVQVAIQLLRHYLSLAELNVEETKLLRNYPNPFNPDTWIPYQLSEGSTVTVKIYDVSGSLVRTIGVGHKPVGYYLTRERPVYWNGRNENGEGISSGVYFYTLITDDYTQTRRMVIAK